MKRVEDQLAISALQHYAYCPRQFALIHIEQAWSENRWTAEGRLLHERVDAGYAEQRRGVRYERGVLLMSQSLRLTGKADLIEVHSENDDRSGGIKYFPVEYKRGRPKVEDWDRIQLCAQALCIEEMRDTEVTEGALWYWQVRRREPVVFDESLRQKTLSVIEEVADLLLAGNTPPPIKDRRRCKACSLVDLCHPSIFISDHTDAYIQRMYAENEVASNGSSR